MWYGLVRAFCQTTAQAIGKFVIHHSSGTSVAEARRVGVPSSDEAV